MCVRARGECGVVMLLCFADSHRRMRERTRDFLPEELSAPEAKRLWKRAKYEEACCPFRPFSGSVSHLVGKKQKTSVSYLLRFNLVF